MCGCCGTAKGIVHLTPLGSARPVSQLMLWNESRLCGERFVVWLLRHSSAAPSARWLRQGLYVNSQRNEFRFCGERVDVWLLRHSSAAETRHQWHGIGELAHCSTTEALSHSPTLWLFGGEATVLCHHPLLCGVCLLWCFGYHLTMLS